MFRGQEYYTFPTPEALATASMEDLRALGLGFRDKYIFETTRKIVNGEVDLEKLKQEKSTKNIRKRTSNSIRRWTKSSRLHTIIFDTKKI